ncbi:thioredoxin reductase [Microbacterium resistens]|uniref:Thioredoxin reductase n=1 Tax=Microbacterium resistens TaxID=156977 RepID=A0ABU1SCH4_9MICO|nr:NAD(P)/FAD-dependent oxidoreductase [Microbacterium resistens]MDR6867317.1 thioredoxin reductase [Microbacterium resistens]
MYDAIIIGGGPAGLQAALTLGRMHRTALLLDSGEYRNGTVEHMHHVIANDGTPPAVFRETARAQLAEYGTVEVRSGAAEDVVPVADGFEVTLADGGTVSARRLILATGVADDLPDVPGLDRLWGLRAFSCPFCDGHEYHGRTVGMLGAGPRAEHLASLLGPIVGELVAFPLDAPPSAEEREALESRGVRVHPDPVQSVAARGDGVAVTAGGTPIAVDGLFVTAGSFRQRAPFAERLGLRMLPSGGIEIDEFGRTSLPGVSAAGDIAHRATLPGVIASVVMASAAGQMAAVGIVQELSTLVDP